METTGLLEKASKKHDPFAGGELLLAVPTTESQREIWSSLILDENSTLCYNEVLSIEFLGHLNVKALNSAFQEVLRRHESLRTFFSADGKFFYVGAFKEQPVLIKENLSESEVVTFLREEVSTKFDLINGPCFKGTLIRKSDGTEFFVLSAHHLICDGWSFAIILNELGQIYSAIIENRPIQLDAPSQFSEYAGRKFFTTDKDYWLNEFKTLPSHLNFPTDNKRPAWRTYDSKRIDVNIDPDLVKKLKQVGNENRASLYTVLMSGFAAFSAKLTKQDDLVIGMASATQSVTGKWDLVGHLVNLLPLRIKIEPSYNFIDLLGHVKKKMLDASEKTDFSFGSLVKELPVVRDPSRIPLMNVVFNIDQQAPDQGLHFKNIKASYKTVPRDYENFELFINMVSCGDQLAIECQYNTNLWNDSTIQSWLSQYIEFLSEISQNPKQSLLIEREDKTIEVINQKEEISIGRNLEVEEKILKVWKQILKLDTLTVTDNFFNVGGHSLLAIEVVNEIKKGLACDIKVKDLFLNPTVMRLASQIKATSTKIEQIKSDKFLQKSPVSYSQLQAWYLEEMHPETQMHNLPSSIRLKTNVDRVILEDALNFLIDRHPAFRTSIQIDKGIPVQILREVKKQKLEEVFCSENMIQKTLNLEADFKFDTKQPPLYKAKLFKLGENDYVFFFMVHHAIWDGWSFDIFFEELDIVYSALAKKQKPEFLKNPEISYLDFAQWQRSSLENGGFDEEMNFWKAKLKAPLPVLDLPADFKRPKEISHTGKTIFFSLSKNEQDKIKEIARKNNTSLFNVFLTAFKITVARYSGLSDIVVGSPVRNRVGSECLNTIGYFVNSVALRSEIDVTQSFETNLRNVSETCLQAFAHQSLPFQALLNKIEVPKDSSRSPVFQVFFSYQDVSNRSARFDGIPYSQINVDKASVHTDLDLWIKTNDSKIEGAFEFRADLFKAITIERLRDVFFWTLFESMQGLPTAHEDLLLKQWNNTFVDEKSLKPFHHLFEEFCTSHPEKEAVRTSSSVLSYQELNQNANRIAHSLLERKVGSGDLIGISLNRHEYLLSTILGVLKTGAGYVPLDPGFPQDRLDYMVESSSPKFLISEESISGRFKGNNLLDVKLLIQNKSETNPQSIYRPESPMYVIYTSGSTGKPKGVQVSYKAMTNFLHSMRKTPGLSVNDKLLAVTTFSFDIAGLELYLPLMSGASIFLAAQYEVLDGESLKTIIDENQISVMQATPSTWRLLLSAGWKPSKGFKVLCGGESFPIDLAEKLLALNCEVWNMYGPTETTVWSTCKKIVDTSHSLTIGRPIDNTSTFILDERKKLVPIGAAGELYIGGSGLADGYFGRPDLTAERFIKNPFLGSEKIYSTGDYARFTADGEIECLGRKDGQVKIRGYRIELGEIELCLSQVKGISEAAVITKEVSPQDVRIIAFFKSSADISEKEIRNELEIKLPKYMIPSHFVRLPELPKTLNGKIDKKELAPLFAVSAKERVSEPKKSGNKLREMWCGVLGKDDFNDTDSFFDIGGNSLLAVQLFSRLSQELNLELPLSSLLKHPSFAEFSLLIEGPKEPANPTVLKSLVVIKSKGSKKPLFCFHGVGGNVLNYVALAPNVKDRPLIALQSLGLDGSSEVSSSVQEMASHYIREMRLVQDEGPWFLAGGSMGGMIAIEVAKQLKAAGEEVEKLILLDTFGPDVDIKSYDESERSFWTNLKISLYYKSRVLLNTLRVFFLKMFGLTVPLEIKLFDLEMNNYRCLWKYHPSHYEGDLHIIRGRMRDKGWYSDPHMGWKKTIIGQIHTYEIDGNHSQFVESPGLGKVLEGLL